MKMLTTLVLIIGLALSTISTAPLSAGMLQPNRSVYLTETGQTRAFAIGWTWWTVFYIVMVGI